MAIEVVSSSPIGLKLLCKDNYRHWSVQVKTYLKAQDLWDIVEATIEPPKPEDEDVFKGWNKKNDMALYAIQISCEPDTFDEIIEITSAKIAWDTLAEKYTPKIDSDYMATQVSSSPIILKLHDIDNYMEWSVQVKTYLKGQDLWDIIEATTKPPKPEDDEAAFKAWSKKNAMALHAIQISCEPDTFDGIREITLAKIAWDTLVEEYTPSIDLDYMATQGSWSAIVLELLKKNLANYTHWSVQVKTYLKSQDLWDIIEATTEPPKPEDNDMALHAIRISCEPDLVDEIREITSAKIAWDTLAKKYTSIIDSETESEDIENNDYSELYKAVVKGDWEAAKEFLNHHPDAVAAKITFRGNTALHTAVDAGHVHIVKELVELMSGQNLEIQNNYGDTALNLTTFRRGSEQMAECMIRKNNNLVSIAKKKTSLPVVMAICFGHINLGRYLYSITPLETLTAENGIGGAALLNQLIYSRTFDIALDLLHRCPQLAIAVDGNNFSPLMALTDVFPSGNKLVFWKRWIYSCIYIQRARATNETRVNIQQSDQAKVTNSVLAPLDQLVSHLLKLFGIKQIHEMKLFHVQSNELLRLMCEEISISNQEQWITGGVYKSIYRAIREGIFEVVYELVRTNRDLIWACDFQKRNIFFTAVEYRQAKIFSLIYGLDLKNKLINEQDSLGNNIFHMAGMLTASTKGSLIPGAALQMQRELQWFKEVESIMHPRHKNFNNKDYLTPQKLFTRKHKDMRKEGEKWMKGTATSCTVVGALIMTIMFAAAFTVPGGNDQTTGFPMFLKQGKLFMLFIVSDALSLFSSSTSVLMFLGILTSRYAEQDFLKSLPTKMIIGLSTLFFSIATMMIAFSAGLLLLLRQQSWIVIPVICLASVPVTLFVPMQFPLLVDMFKSTYGPGIFDRKMKPWI